MKRLYDLCVIFAEMRTGSNHLEAMLDGVLGLRGCGEAFNPSFVGRPNQDELHGFDLARREADPVAFLDAIRSNGAMDLPVIRFFHDHDRRVLDGIVADPRVAKVILTRNPLDSYLSHKVAVETGQWKMTDARAQKQADIRFVPTEFQAMLEAWQGFATSLRRGLQVHGQTAFEINYDAINDPEVLNGLLRFLGSHESIDPSHSNLRPQNPGGPLAKVINPVEMEQSLGQLDPLALWRPGRTETARPAIIKRFAVSRHVMMMPVPGVLTDDWSSWFGDEAQRSNMSQRELRQWMRRNPGHVKITCVQHPLARAHAVFCSGVLPRQPATSDARRRLRKRYDIPLPQDWPDDSYDRDAHRAAFEAFLRFLKPCLAGQTSLAPLPEWSGQLASLQGMADFAVPDRILRAEELDTDLRQIGLDVPATRPHAGPFDLSEIYDDALEKLARDAYRRDYVFFGYGAWRDYAA